MNNSQIRSEVASLIKVVKDTFDRFEIQEYIPQTELDEMVSTVENLYRKTVILGCLNALPDAAPENSLVQSVEVEGVVAEADTSMLSPETEIVIEKQVEIIQNQVEEHLPMAEATVIADLREEAVIPVVEKVVVNETVNLTANVINTSPKQLVDLKAGIGINDKFQFIAELFAGSGEKYEGSIKHLNSLESLASSLVYLEEIQTNYKWKEDSAAAERLVELVKRRFL